MDNRNRDNINSDNRYNDNRDVNKEEFERHDRNRDQAINESERRENDPTHYKNRGENKRLHFLDDLSDYKVAKGDPDVRGWDVIDVNNQKVGKVDNLLVDIKREKVRYLDVDLDQNLIGKDHDELATGNASGVHEYKKGGDVHMIVPIGLARIDRSNKRVISDEINSRILQEGHFHRKGEHITPEHERNVVTSVRSYENTANLDSTNRAGGGPGTPTGVTGTPTGTTTNPVTGSTGSTGTPGTSGTSETYNMRNPESRTGDTENREMRRPESSGDTNLSRSSETSRSERDIENRSAEGRDRGPNVRNRNLSDEERRAGESQNREPIQDDFYDNRYFDDRRFYGKEE